MIIHVTNLVLVSTILTSSYLSKTKNYIDYLINLLKFTTQNTEFKKYYTEHRERTLEIKQSICDTQSEKLTHVMLTFHMESIADWEAY